MSIHHLQADECWTMLQGFLEKNCSNGLFQTEMHECSDISYIIYTPVNPGCPGTVNTRLGSWP